MMLVCNDILLYWHTIWNTDYVLYISFVYAMAVFIVGFVTGSILSHIKDLTLHAICSYVITCTMKCYCHLLHNQIKRF